MGHAHKSFAHMTYLSLKMSWTRQTATTQPHCSLLEVLYIANTHTSGKVQMHVIVIRLRMTVFTSIQWYQSVSDMYIPDLLATVVGHKNLSHLKVVAFLHDLIHDKVSDKNVISSKDRHKCSFLNHPPI